MKFTMSQDGIERADIKVEYRLSKEEIAAALAVEAEIWLAGEELPEEMGVREIMKHVRNALKYYGEDTLWGREIDEELLEWAKKQVDRLVK